MRNLLQLCLLLFSITIQAQTPLQNPPFLNALENIDLTKISSQDNLFCPGLVMVNTCGDGVCDAWRFENKDNCPADCVPAKLHSYNFQTLCTEIDAVYKPNTVTEARELILDAYKHQQKVKVIGNAHTASSAICTNGIIITTENLNKIIGLQTHNGQTTVQVEPGVKLFELADYLDQHNLSLGIPLMGYNGVSIAGAIATGSHGSSIMHDSVISNYVDSLDLITSEGKQIHISETSNAQYLKAARTNLGLMGMVVAVNLKTQPQFNLQVDVSFHDDKELFSQPGYRELLENCDYGQFNWFPGVGRFMKTCGTKTNKPAEAGAHNTLLDPQIPDLLIKPFKTALQLGACYHHVNCLLEAARFAQFQLQPPFMKHNDQGEMVYTNHVVGPSHQMITSNLTHAQAGFFQMDWEVAVPEPYIQDALKAVQSLLKENEVCSALVGLFVRFTKIGDESLMAHAAAHGQFKKGMIAAFIELPVYIPTAFSKEQYERYASVHHEFTKLLITRFHGIAHPAKNRTWAFRLQSEHSPFADNLQEFGAVVHSIDPTGMFSNQFANDYGIP